jgi:hypothetical protein
MQLKGLIQKDIASPKMWQIITIAPFCVTEGFGARSVPFGKYVNSPFRDIKSISRSGIYLSAVSSVNNVSV